MESSIVTKTDIRDSTKTPTMTKTMSNFRGYKGPVNLLCFYGVFSSAPTDIFGFHYYGLFHTGLCHFQFEGLYGARNITFR
jgi:hypothetical protein